MDTTGAAAPVSSRSPGAAVRDARAAESHRAARAGVVRMARIHLVRPGRIPVSRPSCAGARSARAVGLAEAIAGCRARDTGAIEPKAVPRQSRCRCGGGGVGEPGRGRCGQRDRPARPAPGSCAAAPTRPDVQWFSDRRGVGHPPRPVGGTRAHRADRPDDQRDGAGPRGHRGRPGGRDGRAARLCRGTVAGLGISGRSLLRNRQPRVFRRGSVRLAA